MRSGVLHKLSFALGVVSIQTSAKFLHESSPIKGKALGAQLCQQRFICLAQYVRPGAFKVQQRVAQVKENAFKSRLHTLFNASMGNTFRF